MVNYQLIDNDSFTIPAHGLAGVVNASIPACAGHCNAVRALSIAAARASGSDSALPVPLRYPHDVGEVQAHDHRLVAISTSETETRCPWIRTPVRLTR